VDLVTDFILSKCQNKEVSDVTEKALAEYVLIKA